MLKAEVILCLSFKIITEPGGGRWVVSIQVGLILKLVKPAGVNMECHCTFLASLYMSGFFHDKKCIDR